MHLGESNRTCRYIYANENLRYFRYLSNVSSVIIGLTLLPFAETTSSSSVNHIDLASYDFRFSGLQPTSAWDARCRVRLIWFTTTRPNQDKWRCNRQGSRPKYPRTANLPQLPASCSCIKRITISSTIEAQAFPPSTISPRKWVWDESNLQTQRKQENTKTKYWGPKPRVVGCDEEQWNRSRLTTIHSFLESGVSQATRSTTCLSIDDIRFQNSERLLFAWEWNEGTVKSIQYSSSGGKIRVKHRKWEKVEEREEKNLA